MTKADVIQLVGADPAGNIEEELAAAFRAAGTMTSSITTNCTDWSARGLCCC